MKGSQYDDIAQQYQQTTSEEISRKYIEDPNMLRVIGDVTGLDLLGVGCGNCYLERILKKAGANRVVGVDQSEAMLSLGLAEERRQPLGITYIHQDLCTLGHIGEFDLVTAKYVLNYAESSDDLYYMCRNIHSNLRPGGRLVALVPDYAETADGLPSEPKYGFTAEAINLPLVEGEKLKIALYGGESKVTFIVGFWKQASYEEALRKAGFRNITWHKPMPSAEGIEKYGVKFWAEWIAHPYSQIIEAWR